MMAGRWLGSLLETGPVNDKIVALRDGVVNAYLVKAADGLVCIDTGWRPACVAAGFRALGLNTRDVAHVLLTHWHWDHAGCLCLFTHADVYVGEREDLFARLRRLKDQPRLHRVTGGRTLSIGGLSARVIDTPGHTPGSVCYLVDGAFLFTGDALRLKGDRALPFPRLLNRDNAAAKQSVRNMAGIKGVECLLTGHHGICCDVDMAFGSWRGLDRGRMDQRRGS